jgi:UDP-glucuronate decarboxylase
LKFNYAVTEQDVQTIIAAPLPWEELSGRNILITGANGLIPSYMVDTLLALNDSGILQQPVHVYALVRNEHAYKARFHKHLDSPYLHLIIQDVCEPLNININIDYIVHAASQASPKYYSIDPVGTLKANINGTMNLLELAQTKPIQSMLLMSSGEVYGDVSEEMIPTKENDYGYINSMNVRSCYAESKRMAETMCVSWYHQFGVPVKVARPYHTYGPGLKLNDGRVFADFVKNVVESTNIIMRSEGSDIRAFCYLADATIGFFTVLLKGKNGEAYNVGNPQQAISILELAETIVKLFPEKKLQIERVNITDNYLRSPIKKNIPDISKMEQLGWYPATSIRDGFYKTIVSFCEVD